MHFLTNRLRALGRIRIVQCVEAQYMDAQYIDALYTEARS